MVVKQKPSKTILGGVYERFVEETPVAVMARGVLERCLSPATIDRVFGSAADRQYNKDLLFSTVFEVMTDAVCQVHSSVHAAYRARRPEGGPSYVALYDKLKKTEAGVTAALVRHTAQELGPLIERMGGKRPAPLPGCPTRIVDGSWMASTERRLKVLRELLDEAMPGKALVVLDPEAMLVREMIPCEDGHAQERVMLSEALALVQPGELWIADRNICTLGWVQGVDQARAFFLLRQHSCFPVEELEPFRRVGRNKTGVVSEQNIRVVLPNGEERRWRRIRVQLDKPTREGEKEIFLLTNLRRGRAGARKVADLYLGRWTIERVFQEIEASLNCEIDTLAYPKAALLGLAVGLVAYNALAAVKGAMRAVHGVQTVEQEISGYYLADELKSTHRGLGVAVAAQTWQLFRQMSLEELARELMRLAGKMHLCRYEKNPRGPKKPQPPRKRIGGRGHGTHVSTARLLNPDAYVKK
jgi:hypothetical protein